MSTRFARRRTAGLLLAIPLWAAAASPQSDASGTPAPGALAPATEGAQRSHGLPHGGGIHVPGFGQRATASALEQARGGDGGIASDTSLGAVVSGNSASNVVTGSNTIQASSFAGATGIPIVIQNTGANVLIQNATVINLQLQ